MASTTDPRAAAFDAAEFRDGVKFAMSMGLPDDTSERLTFRWRDDKTYTTADPTGKPYDYSDTPSRTVTKDDVQITAGVKFISRATSAANTPVGQMDLPRVIVTILDEDYDSVSDADEIVLDGNTYTIDYWEPPTGLFDVTIYNVHASAVDES